MVVLRPAGVSTEVSVSEFCPLRGDFEELLAALDVVGEPGRLSYIGLARSDSLGDPRLRRGTIDCAHTFSNPVWLDRSS